MADDISLKCTCGEVTGKATGLSAENTNHIICHCADCRTFVEHLGGRTEPEGGVQITQMSPARIRIIQGTENIRCLRLSEKGPFRWYTDCCNTPIGATPPSAGIPSVGMLHNFIDLPPEARTSIFGPVRGHVFLNEATGTTEKAAAIPKAGLALWVRMYCIVIGWKLRGDARRNFFYKDG